MTTAYGMARKFKMKARMKLFARFQFKGGRNLFLLFAWERKVPHIKLAQIFDDSGVFSGWLMKIYAPQGSWKFSIRQKLLKALCFGILIGNESHGLLCNMAWVKRTNNFWVEIHFLVTLNQHQKIIFPLICFHVFGSILSPSQFVNILQHNKSKGKSNKR